MIAALALAVGVATSLGGQTRPSDSTPGAELTVYLVTFDSGAEIWERFGHNALWIHDPEAGTDQAYDYGRFSFQTERFFLRFAVGDLRYWMGEGDVRSYLAGYERAGRSIWIQELDLPMEARLRLRDFLKENVKEENKYYQYHYYLDNCSTRIRDAIDRAVDGQLRRWAESRPTSFTYRDHTRRLTQNSPVFRTVLDIGLGQPVDRRVTAWAEMFLPISLRPWLDSVTVTDPEGHPHPLIRSERHVVESDRFPVPATPADWRLGYLAIGTILGLGIAGSGRAAGRSARGRVAFRVVGTTWAFVTGLAGLALAGLWAFTRHDFSYRNENLFQLNLISLALAAVLPRALRSGGRRYRLAVWLAATVAALGALGLVVKFLPVFYQDNLTIVALVLPIHLGLLAGLLAAGDRTS